MVTPKDFNAGSAYARDLVLAMIIGEQNAIGNQECDEYKLLQKLYERIVCQCGDMCQPFSG